MNLDLYWQAAGQAVCPKCIDGDGEGNCLLPRGENCAMQAHFPLVVESVLSVKSEQVEPYRTAMRTTVCTVCGNRSPGAGCRVRARLDCGLDRYFPLVIEAIELCGNAAA